MLGLEREKAGGEREENEMLRWQLLDGGFKKPPIYKLAPNQVFKFPKQPPNFKLVGNPPLKNFKFNPNILEKFPFKPSGITNLSFPKYGLSQVLFAT